MLVDNLKKAMKQKSHKKLPFKNFDTKKAYSPSWRYFEFIDVKKSKTTYLLLMRLLAGAYIKARK